MNDAERHLAAVCKHFAQVVPHQEPYPTRFEKNRDPYRALVRAVVFQQLSGKAAATIHGRLLALYPGKSHPEPEDLLIAPFETLRGAGLSRQKIAAIQDIARKRREGVIPGAGTVGEFAARAALGLGGEGYLSFSIATPTGEGVSNPRTFTRVRRCVMVDNLKIY